MAKRFIISWDLTNQDNVGLNLSTISYLQRLHITLTPEIFEQALHFLEENVSNFIIYCDCTALKSTENIISLLNHGTFKAFVTCEQLESIANEGLLAGQDLARLIVSIDHAASKSNPQARIESALSVARASNPDVAVSRHFHDVRDWETVGSILQQSSKEGSGDYVSLKSDIREHYAKAIKQGLVAIIPANGLTTDTEEHPDLLPAHVLITDALQSDRPDGLFPTVVTDDRGTCLGLVYSNERSIQKALQLGRGVYHSRRHGLWIKGQESGDTQELVSIAVDCDADALQSKVRQKGQGDRD